MKDRELIKEFNNLHPNKKLSEDFSEHLWSSLYLKYNELQNLMENKNRGFNFSIFSKQSWLVSVLTIFIFFLAVAVPTYSYYKVPDFKNTIDLAISKIFNTNKKGTLILNTAQDEIEIFIDGESIGNAPINTDLREGEYMLKAYKKNHSVAYYDLQITEETTTEINIELIPVLYDDDTEYTNWNLYENTDRGSGITYKYPSGWEVQTSNLNPSTLQVTFTKGDIQILLYHYLDEDYDSGIDNVIPNENLIDINYDLDQNIKSVRKSLYLKGESPQNDFKIESLSIFWTRQNDLSSEDFNTIFKIIKSCNFMTQYNDGTEYEDGQEVINKTLRPERNYYNFLVKESTGNVKGFIKSYTKSTPVTNYYSDWTPLLSTDQIIVYRTSDGSILTSTIDFNTPNILIEPNNTSNISVEFEPISISPNGKKMAMRVTVLDISKCTPEICEFPEYLKEGLGWKSGIYVVDLYLNKNNFWYTNEIMDIQNTNRSGWTDDSRYLYSIVESKYLMYFDVESQKISKYSLSQSSYYYTGVVMQNPNGGYIQTQTKDNKTTTVRSFKIVNDQIVIERDIITYSNGFEVPMIALSPDGRYLLLGSSSKVYDLQKSEIIEIVIKGLNNNNSILQKGFFLNSHVFVGIYYNGSEVDTLVEYDLTSRQIIYQYQKQGETFVEIN